VRPDKVLIARCGSLDRASDIVFDRERRQMAKKAYKCFKCGKLYDDEQSAIKCHNAPIQKVVKTEGAPKPRFLGN